MAGSSTSFFGSQTVSPVFHSILPMATMSPQQASLTSVFFLPHMVYIRPSLSVLLVRILRRDRSDTTLPDSTLMKEYLPNWSEMVLNTNAHTGPFGSTASLPPSAVATSPMSAGLGT